ncbi:MAG: hypothetical protein JXR37_05775 [Kiritimatiellae bacterium]|nr:hypothetical protein [Kiritimatiellia bacterium]
MIAACLLAAAAPCAAAETYQNGFDGPDATQRWRPIVGEWRMSDSRYACVRDPVTGGPAGRTVSTVPLGDGTIEAHVKATARDKPNKGGGFGLMKYVDEQNWLAVRFGSWKNVTLEIFEDGKRRIEECGCIFDPEIGRAYRIRAIFRGSRVLILLDKRVVAVMDGLPVFEGARAGLFAISACEFDDVQVSPAP